MIREPDATEEEDFVPHSGDNLSELRTGADEDEARIRRAREKGLDLVQQFFMALRTLALHEAGNAATRYPIEAVARTLAELHQEMGTVHFINVEGQAYLNDIRLRVDTQAYANVLYVLNLLDRHGVGGITFPIPLDVVALRAMFNLLLTPPAREDPLLSLREKFVAAQIPAELDTPFFHGRDGDRDRPSLGTAEYAAEGFAKGLLAIKDYVRAVEAEGLANPLRIRKVVQDLVDISSQDFSNFLKLTTVHGAEDPLFNHCINVCSLSISIGKELGLSRVELADLGSAALLHDVGYAALNQAGAETLQADRSRHTIAATAVLLRSQDMTPALVRRLRVALEHHMHFQRPGGFPALGNRRPSVFARIVSVADHYDALITSTDERRGLTPGKALERIVAAAGVRFDPAVVRALVRALGRYPFGSVVKLNNGSLALVVSGGRSGTAFTRPLVRIIRDEEGQEVRGEPVDLAEPEHRRLRVVSILDAESEGISTGRYLFGKESDPGADDPMEFSSPPVSVDSPPWERSAPPSVPPEPEVRPSEEEGSPTAMAAEGEEPEDGTESTEVIEFIEGSESMEFPERAAESTDTPEEWRAVETSKAAESPQTLETMAELPGSSSPPGTPPPPIEDPSPGELEEEVPKPSPSSGV